MISSRECLTVRHLLEQAGTKCWLRMKELAEPETVHASQPRCDSLNSLASQLEKLLKFAPKFVLVFDGIDRQKEATPILIPGLARLGHIVGLIIMLDKL
jgi:origin recognition complex subunit 5